MHFGEGPAFLAVGSVVTQYERIGELRPDPRIAPFGNDPNAEIEGKLTFRETPTITYAPITGDKYVRTLLQPIAPATLVGMMESGWAADELFALTTRSINGVRNASGAPLFAETGDARFAEVIGALRRLQKSGAIDVRIVARDKVFSARAYMRADLTASEQADLALLQRELGMQGEALRGEVPIVFAAYPDRPGELAIATRSMMEVLQLMSLGVDETGEGQFDPQARVRVHSSKSEPQSAYAAVSRHGRWYWIAADDRASQRALLIAQVLLAVSAEGTPTKEPLLTIPVN
jgi:hypothetical protein